MIEEEETDAELLARYITVREKYEAAKRKAMRIRPGSFRDRRMRLAGCLNFTLCTIIDKIEDRGLKKPK